MNPVTRIVVLRGSLHGDSAATYAEELRARIENVDIEYARTPPKAHRLLSDAEVATGCSITSNELEVAPKLRLFACATAGVEHLPLERLRAADIAVTTGSGIHRPNVAEHVIDVLLTLVRRTTLAIERQRRNHWQTYRPWGTIAGMTATVVGLGPIGRSIATMLDNLDVSTIGVRHTPEKGGPSGEVIGYDRAVLHDALSRSDAVVLACPLSEETTRLIGREALRTIPPHCILVNVSRGEVVDTDALVSALRRNALRGVALDVTDPEPLPADHPLWNFENVLITPHVAGFDPNYWAQRAEILARNVERIEETGTFTDLENSAYSL